MALSVKRMIVATLTALALPMAALAEDGSFDPHLHLLRTADITDDPERQACIRAGRAWRNDQCEAP